MMAQKRQDWERFGAEDPYYGSITVPRFRGSSAADNLGDFFRSGQEQIDGILEVIRSQWSPSFRPARALDFGCGAGRCTLALAGVCREVVGVDVSDAMLEEARAAGRRQGIENVLFAKSDDTLSQVTGHFDLIHSSFTFQHIPPRRGLQILQRLISLLSDSGVAVLDFLIARDVPKLEIMLGKLRRRIPLFHNLANLLELKPFREPYMEKNVYDLNAILTLLQELGCGEVHVQMFRNGRNRDALIFLRRSRERPISHERFMSKWASVGDSGRTTPQDQ